MGIWEVSADYTYKDIGFVDVKKDWEIPTYELKGNSIKDTWNPIAVDLIGDEDKQEGDFSTLATVPVAVTKEASLFLTSTSIGEIELLPLNCMNCSRRSIHIVNVLNVIDCLDENKSDIKRFDDGSVMVIYKYAFRQNIAKNTTIFKIPQTINSREYVTTKFVENYEKKGMKGLNFKLLADL